MNMDGHISTRVLISTFTPRMTHMQHLNCQRYQSWIMNRTFQRNYKYKHVQCVFSHTLLRTLNRDLLPFITVILDALKLFTHKKIPRVQEENNCEFLHELNAPMRSMKEMKQEDVKH